jgi:hypothetical protein
LKRLQALWFDDVEKDEHQPQKKGAAMESVLCSVRKRKKVRRLGDVKVLSREEYAEFDLDAKVEAIRALVPLGLLHVKELLDEEVKALAGERYARKAASMGGRRHGSNPGTVGLGGQRVPIRIPRVRNVSGVECLAAHTHVTGHAAHSVAQPNPSYQLSHVQHVRPPACHGTSQGKCSAAVSENEE